MEGRRERCHVVMLDFHFLFFSLFFLLSSSL